MLIRVPIRDPASDPKTGGGSPKIRFLPSLFSAFFAVFLCELCGQKLFTAKVTKKKAAKITEKNMLIRVPIRDPASDPNAGGGAQDSPPEPVSSLRSLRFFFANPAVKAFHHEGRKGGREDCREGHTYWGTDSRPGGNRDPRIGRDDQESLSLTNPAS
jgi:hypothetical protein